jgi:Leucine-rich repeat (LRR) protein
MQNFLNHRILSLFRCCPLKIVFFLALFLISDAAFCQKTSQSKVTEIRQQMAKIRQSTNWDNPAEAKKANEQIKVLMQQLVAATSASSSSQGNAGGNNQSGSEGSNSDGNKMGELQMDMAKHKVDVFTQIWEAGSEGKSAPVLLAKPLREEIAAEFAEDDKQGTMNPVILDELSYLCLNMSMPGVDAVIEQMPNFKGIRMLVIIAGDHPGLVDFSTIFRNARDYPLQSLSILDFKQSVKKIPPEVFSFTKLTSLGIFNNAVSAIPPDISKLSSLTELYVDINPVSTLFPWISSLTKLEKLGVEKTAIPVTEIEKLKKLLPNCQILEK